VLLAVEPPWDVDVDAAGAVFVGEREIFEGRDLAAQTRGDRIHDVFADGAAGIGDAVGEAGRFGIEENADALAGTGGEDDHAGGDAALLAGEAVDVDDAGGLTVFVEGDLSDHGIGEDVEIAGGERGREMDGGRLVVGFDRTTAAAIGGPEAGGAGAHGLGEDALGAGIAGVEFGGDVFGVLLHAQHGAVGGDDGDAEGLGFFLREEFAGAHGGRRKQDAGGGVGVFSRPSLLP